MSVVAPHFAFRTATLLPATASVRAAAAGDAHRAVPGDRPLALLPVRLETRFFPQPNGSSELRVRVYPDKIHIDSHEPELTPAEKTWGQHYWTQILARRRRHAGADECVAAARRSIRSRSARRGSRGCCGRRTGQRPPARARPRPEQRWRRRRSSHASMSWTEGKDAAWRQRAAGAAAARSLDRDRALGRARRRRGRRPRHPAGRSPSVPIRRSMPTPRPRFPATRLAVDAGMRWMVDFDEAEAAGMALRIPLTPRRSRRPASTACSCSARPRARRRMTARSNSAICSTRITTPTASSSCASARRRTTRGRALGLRRRGPGTRAQLRDGVRRSRRRRSMRSRTRQRLGTALGLPGARHRAGARRASAAAATDTKSTCAA